MDQTQLTVVPTSMSCKASQYNLVIQIDLTEDAKSERASAFKSVLVIFGMGNVLKVFLAWTNNICENGQKVDKKPFWERSNLLDDAGILHRN